MPITLTRQQAKAIRAEWRAMQPDECMACGAPRLRKVWPIILDTHEILRGVYREAAMAEPACLLVLCRTCHDNVPSGRDGVIWGLAVKQLADLEHYDMGRVLDIYRPNATPEWRAQMYEAVELVVRTLKERFNGKD